MGSIKPEYPRIVENTQYIGDDQCNAEGYGLTWLRDSQKHREDIMTSQMAKQNQSRYESLYTK